MNNGATSVAFTVATGETLIDKTLGPAVDHTLNTPSGHFLYWYRPVQNLRVRVDGIINTPAFQLQPNLCLNFAYYINSISTSDKLTALGVALIGCSEGLIWSVKIIDSKGWQTVEANLPQSTCIAMLSFFVSSNATGGISVSVDDILIDTCTITPTTTLFMPSMAALSSSSRYSFLLLVIHVFSLINQF